MRLILELAVVAALVALGWNQSFSERVGVAPASQTTTKAEPAVSRATPVVRATVASTPAPLAQIGTAAPAAAASAAPNNAWMWDPNRQGSLDRKGTPRPSPRP